MIFDGSPTSALYPGVTMFVGLERDFNDSSLRLYFGHRSRNIHTHVPPGDEADNLERKLGGNHHGHIWVRDVDPDCLCDCLNVVSTVEDDRG